MVEPTETPATPTRIASSGTSGFFQTPPKLTSQFDDDATLRRVYDFFIPSRIQSLIAPDLSHFSALVISPQILSYIADAELRPPTVSSHTTFGRRHDKLTTSHGWQSLQNIGLQEGIVAIGHENQYRELSRVYQFLKYHLWSGSCAYTTCPSGMQDGAAALLRKHLQGTGLDEQERKVLQHAYDSLTSREVGKAWTSGQWMTERMGGSDVRGTETLATLLSPEEQHASGEDASGMPLGPWKIDGFKWFSSATDSAMTVLLAQTSKGLSAFYAPMRRTVLRDGVKETELNGIQIQRLKNKLGTRAVPTAELVLSSTRAYLLGEEGKGTKEISSVLNITRVHNAATAVAFWGRGLAISRAFARVRKSGGKLLMDIPAHVRTMAGQEVEYRANMFLTYFIVALLGISEQQDAASAVGIGAREAWVSIERADAATLLRLLTPVAKGLTAKASIKGLAECMESLGGVGYLENEEMEFNVARLFRDANVLSIWEGTTDIMADDLVRVLKGREDLSILDACDRWIMTRVKRLSEGGYGLELGLSAYDMKRFDKIVKEAWMEFIEIVKLKDTDELKYMGREVMERLGWLICAVLLVEDLKRDGDDVALEMARRWMLKSDGKKRKRVWKSDAVKDRKIVFGTHEKAGPRL